MPRSQITDSHNLLFCGNQTLSSARLARVIFFCFMRNSMYSSLRVQTLSVLVPLVPREYPHVNNWRATDHRHRIAELTAKCEAFCVKTPEHARMHCSQPALHQNSAQHLSCDNSMLPRTPHLRPTRSSPDVCSPTTYRVSKPSLRPSRCSCAT